MFENIAQVWMHWSVRTFQKADSVSSLNKCMDEIYELKGAIELRRLNAINGDALLHEYADVILCVLHSAAKEGFNIQQVQRAMREKAGINYQRKWKLDSSGDTYSHIK